MVVDLWRCEGDVVVVLGVWVRWMEVDGGGYRWISGSVVVISLVAEDRNCSKGGKFGLCPRSIEFYFYLYSLILLIFYGGGWGDTICHNK